MPGSLLLVGRHSALPFALNLIHKALAALPASFCFSWSQSLSFGPNSLVLPAVKSISLTILK